MDMNNSMSVSAQGDRAIQQLQDLDQPPAPPFELSEQGQKTSRLMQRYEQIYTVIHGPDTDQASHLANNPSLTMSECGRYRDKYK